MIVGIIHTVCWIFQHFNARIMILLLSKSDIYILWHNIAYLNGYKIHYSYTLKLL